VVRNEVAASLILNMNLTVNLTIQARLQHIGILSARIAHICQESRPAHNLRMPCRHR
jgi:hypothetical protein